jgi:hypothetical protein
MQFENRKNSAEKERNIAARVFSLEGEPIMECVIREISAVGARIVVAYCPELVPDRFRLEIHKVKPMCRVQWTNGNEFGIKFYR